MPEIKVNACGILPLSKYKNTLYVLCGQEQFVNGWEGSGKFCGFGGHKEGNESNRRCAARECYEESMGFIGTEKHLFKQLASNNKNLLGIEKEANYVCYYLMIPYDGKLPHIYNNVYKYLMGTGCTLTKKDGMFEKPTMKWFKATDLVKYHNNPTTYTKKPFRSGFLSMLVRFLEKNNL
jgi:hypothetical protein